MLSLISFVPISPSHWHKTPVHFLCISSATTTQSISSHTLRVAAVSRRRVQSQSPPSLTLCVCILPISIASLPPLLDGLSLLWLCWRWTLSCCWFFNFWVHGLHLGFLMFWNLFYKIGKTIFFSPTSDACVWLCEEFYNFIALMVR